MFGLPPLVSLVSLALGVFSAPAGRITSDSSSISLTEDHGREEKALRNSEPENPVEFNKEVSQILEKVANYVNTQFAESNQLSNLKCEIATREMQTNFIFHNLRGKLYPQNKPIYTSVILPAIGIRKYSEITPDIYIKRIHFFSITSNSTKPYNQSSLKKYDPEDRVNSILKVKEVVEASTPEAVRLKNARKTETRFSDDFTIEKIGTINAANTFLDKLHDDSNKNKIDSQHYSIEKKENASLDSSIILNNGPVFYNKNVTYNTVNKNFTFTTFKPSTPINRQESNNDRVAIANSSSFELTGGPVSTNLNIFETNALSLTEFLSRSPDMELTSTIAVNRQLTSTANKSYETTQNKRLSNNVETSSTEITYSASTNPLIDTKTIKELAYKSSDTDFLSFATDSYEESSFPKYYGKIDETSSSLPIVSSDDNKRFKPDDSLHTDLINRYTFHDAGTSIKITSPMESNDLFDAITEGVNTIIDNTELNMPDFLQTSTDFYSKLSLDNETTTPKYYKHLFNSTELSTTTPTENIQSTSLYSKIHDFNNYYSNMDPFVSPNIFNFSTAPNLLPVTTNFSRTETENEIYLSKETENVTYQSITMGTVITTPITSNEIHEFFINGSSTIKPKENDTLFTSGNIYTNSGFNSETMLQNSTSSTVQSSSDFKETSRKNENSTSHDIFSKTTTDLDFTVNSNIHPSKSIDHQRTNTLNEKSPVPDTATSEYKETANDTHSVSSLVDLIYTLSSPLPTKNSSQPSKNIYTPIYDIAVTKQTNANESYSNINLLPDVNFHSIQVSPNSSNSDNNSGNITNGKLLKYTKSNKMSTSNVESPAIEEQGGESVDNNIHHPISTQDLTHFQNKYTESKKLETIVTAILDSFVTTTSNQIINISAPQTDLNDMYNITSQTLGQNEGFETNTEGDEAISITYSNFESSYNNSTTLNTNDTRSITLPLNIHFNQPLHSTPIIPSSKTLRTENYITLPYSFTTGAPRSSMNEDSLLTKSNNLIPNESSSTFSNYESTNFTNDISTGTDNFNYSYSQQEAVSRILTLSTLNISRHMFNTSTSATNLVNNEPEVTYSGNHKTRSTANFMGPGDKTINIKDNVTYIDINNYFDTTTETVDYINILKETTGDTPETTAHTVHPLTSIYEEVNNNSLINTNNKSQITPTGSLGSEADFTIKMDDNIFTGIITNSSSSNNYKQESITTLIADDYTGNNSFSNTEIVSFSKLYSKNEMTPPYQKSPNYKNQTELKSHETMYGTDSFSLLTHTEILPYSDSFTTLSTINTATNSINNKTGVIIPITTEVTTSNYDYDQTNFSGKVSTKIQNVYSTLFQYNNTMQFNATSIFDKTTNDFKEPVAQNISTTQSEKINDITINSNLENSSVTVEALVITSDLYDLANSLSTSPFFSTFKNSSTTKVTVTNISYVSDVNQSTEKKFSESTTFRNKVGNISENKYTVGTNSLYSFTDSPVDTSTTSHLEIIEENVSEGNSTLNVMDIIEKTSTDKYNITPADINNLTAVKIIKSDSKDLVMSNEPNINNYIFTTPSLTPVSQIFSTTKVLVISDDTYDSTIHQYSQETPGEVTMDNLAEKELEYSEKVETYTKKKDFTDFEANLSDLENYVDISKDYSTSNILDFVQTTLEDKTYKERSSTVTTVGYHGENQTEKNHHIETITQRYEYSYPVPEKNNSGIQDDDININFKPLIVQDSTEKVTGLYNEKKDISSFPLISTIKSSNGIVTPKYDVSTFISTIINTTTKNTPYETGSGTINSNNQTENKTDDIYNDEINTQMYETTPSLNNFTFFLPTTDFVTSYIPVRIHPLIGFSEIK